MSGIDFYPSPTSQQFTPAVPMSSELPTKPSKISMPTAKAFVLSQPPPPRNAGRLNVNNVVHEEARSSSPAAPPLAPLRELLEGTPSASEGTNPSFDARSNPNDNHINSENAVNILTPTVSSASFNNSQPRTPKAQPNGLRSSPPRQSREEITRKELPKYNRTNTSISSTSSASQKLKPIRTSEDSTTKPTEDKNRSFEQLIHSDQTIQYTLTPQNMRKIEVCIFSWKFRSNVRN